MRDSSQSSARFGLRSKFSASSCLGNLSNTHAGLAAIGDLGGGDDLVLLTAFDHEEIGSATSSRAAGSSLEDVLERITSVAGCDLDTTKALPAHGSCTSTNVGHLVHPNYSQHHDPHVDLVLNGDSVLKVNASQHYVTDAVGEALQLRACGAARVPLQVFVSNSAIPYDSIVGPITATRLGVVTVGVGIELLSMHSARETRGVDDPRHLAAALCAYLER